MASTFNTIVTIYCYVVFAVVAAYLLWLLVCRLIADCKSEQEGIVTLTPVIPFPQDNLQVFKGTDNLENIAPEAKIQVDESTDKKEDGLLSLFGKYYVYRRINEFMASTFELHSRLPDEYEVGKFWTNEKSNCFKRRISVPDNARTISIKMDGYEHGEKCHDFVPIRGAAPQSLYTYQMYGANRIQVTKYVEDGKSEIAGFCIYIENPWLSQGEYRWYLLEDMARSVSITGNPRITEGRRNETNQLRIEVIPEENTELISQESDENYQDWTIKYCLKLRRKVMTSMDSREVVVHQEWSDRNNRMKIEKCEECTKEGLENEEQPPTYSSIFIA